MKLCHALGSLYLSVALSFLRHASLTFLLAGNSSLLLTTSGVSSEVIALIAGQYGSVIMLSFCVSSAASGHDADPHPSVDILAYAYYHPHGCHLEFRRP